MRPPTRPMYPFSKSQSAVSLPLSPSGGPLGGGFARTAHGNRLEVSRSAMGYVITAHGSRLEVGAMILHVIVIWLYAHGSRLEVRSF